LIELLGRDLRFHAELTLQRPDADLVLPKRGGSSTELDVETHDGAMHGLLKRVESEQAQRGLQRRLGRLRGALVKQELSERCERQLAQSLALCEEPLLERRFPYGEAVQELAVIEGSGTVESSGRTVGDQKLELDHVHVDGARVQRDALPVDQQSGRLSHSFAQREQ
jgi:hypothetical protein